MKLSAFLPAVQALAFSHQVLAIHSLRALEDPTIDDDAETAENEGLLNPNYYQADDAIPIEENAAGSGSRFSLWPPPVTADCYLRLNSCVDHAQDLQRNATVAFTLLCTGADEKGMEPPTFLLNRTDFLNIVVVHQSFLAGDFCLMAHEQCHNDGSNNYQGYHLFDNQQNQNQNNNNNNQYNSNNNNNQAEDQNYYDYDEYQQNQYNNTENSSKQNNNNNNNNDNNNNMNYYNEKYNHSSNNDAEDPNCYNFNQYQQNLIHYSYRGTYTGPRIYSFLPQGTHISSTSSFDLPLYYECEASMTECDVRTTTCADELVETAVAYSNCGPVTSLADPIFAGPICASMEVAMQSTATLMDVAIFTQPTCSMNTIEENPLMEGRSSGNALLNRYSSSTANQQFSDAMWRSIVSAPLACMPTRPSGMGTTMVDGVSRNLGWCQSVIEMAQSCQEELPDESNRPLCEHASLGNAKDSGPIGPEVPSDLPLITPQFEQPFYDLTGATLRYEQCHGIGNETSTTSYVSFRMCLAESRDPRNCLEDCHSYVVGIGTYLNYVSRLYQDAQSSACKACIDQCQSGGVPAMPLWKQACDFCTMDVNDVDDEASHCWTRSYTGDWYSPESGVDCNACVEECQKVETMEELGYLDATIFSACQMIWDYDDDGRGSVFAGPICLDGRVKIGVFLDEDCLQYDPTREPEDFLQDGDGMYLRLSYATLESLTSEAADKPLSCAMDTKLSDSSDMSIELMDTCLELQQNSLSCASGTLGEDNIMQPKEPNSNIDSLCPKSGEAGHADAGREPITSETTESESAENFYDLTGASLQFHNCHGPTNAGAAQEAAVSVTTAAASKTSATGASGQYVSFRMCTGGRPNSGLCQDEQEERGCQYYVTDIETYLGHTINHYKTSLTVACDSCSKQCGVDWENVNRPAVLSPSSSMPFIKTACDLCAVNRDGTDDPLCWNRDQIADWYSPGSAVDCSRCSTECSMMAHMEENGYISSSTFRRCKLIYIPDDDAPAPLYAGPRCKLGGDSVQIGVFTDEDCTDLDHGKDVNDYLVSSEGYAMKLSYNVLIAITRQATEKLLSCAVEAPLSNNQTTGGVALNEMCQVLKEESYACRDGTHGSLSSDQFDAPLFHSFCPNTDMSTSASFGNNDPTIVEEGGVFEVSSGLFRFAPSTSLALVAFIASCFVVCW